MNVHTVEVNDWDKDGTIIKVTNVTFDDGSKAPGYDLPSVPEVGKPLPDGWEVATSKAGKPYIKVPKPRGGGGGQSSWYNSEVGVRFTQERTDRRTSVMQATVEGEFHSGVADLIYDWLRRTEGSSVASQTRAGAEGEGTSTTSATVRTEASTSGGGVAGEASAPVACAHNETSPLRPDGHALPAGKVRCLNCSAVVKEVARAQS